MRVEAAAEAHHSTLRDVARSSATFSLWGHVATAAAEAAGIGNINVADVR
jgi:hypothetical protein